MRRGRTLRVLAAGAAWSVALAWVWKALDSYAGMKRLTDLTAGTGPEPLEGPAPLLSVVIAACNEEQAIAATVQSLLASRGLPLEVIAVDDRSTDATGAILDKLAAKQRQPGQLRVLHIENLPEEWLGKPHALAAGAASSRAPWLLFTDGDIFYRDDALLRALTYAIAHQVDHLVLAATPIAHSRGERMVLAAIPVLAAWALRLWRVNEPEARESLGMGAFTLVRRQAYEQVGGWEAVRLEVLEDLRFGWELKRRHGLRQHAVLGRGLVRVHWAAGALGLARNLGKNGFAVFEYRPARLLGSVAGMLVLVFAPLLGWLGPARLFAESRWAVAPYAFAVWLIRRSQARQASQPAGYLLLLPAGALLLIYGLVRSMVLTIHRDGVEWRGTHYPLAMLRANAGPLS